MSKAIIICLTAFSLIHTGCDRVKFTRDAEAKDIQIDLPRDLKMNCQDTMGRGFYLGRCENSEVICYVRGVHGIWCMGK